MLKQLRGSKRLITQVILVIAGVGLVFFFGFSSFQETQVQSSKPRVIAEVNGEPIYANRFQYQSDRQIQMYVQVLKGNVPAPLQQQIQQGVLEQMIHSKLLAQSAKRMGLVISDRELAGMIYSDPSFQVDGRFNKREYLARKEFYHKQTGEDYEESLKEEMLAERLEKSVMDSASLSPEQIQQEYRLRNTQLNLLKVVWPSSIPESSPSESQPRLQTRRPSSEQEREILSVLKSSILPKESAKNPSSQQAVEQLKKKYNLQIEETGLKSVQEQILSLRSSKNFDLLSCLLKLSLEQPSCPRGYELEEGYSFFQLIEKKDADMNKFKEEKQKLGQQLLKQYQNLLLKELVERLTQEAKIKIFDPSLNRRAMN